MRALRDALRRHRRDEQGAVAIMVALCMVGLVVAAALVTDLGLIRIDRQQMKLAADDAVMAGLKAADRGSTSVFSQQGVCGALDFLRSNSAPEFGGLPAGNCASPSLTATCDTANPFTYTGSVSLARRRYTVTIQSPFNVNNGDQRFPEDNFASVSSDNSAQSGCDQIGVVIDIWRQPGLGSIANPNDLHTWIRSVGRVAIGPGSDAPAMLLLKRSGCPILQTGSAAGGSWIHVQGALSSDGLHSQAGTIHADSDGSGCGGSILYGKGADGIVAYAAPLIGNPSVPDPSKPGVISTTAGANGVAIGTIRDSAANVYSSGALTDATAASAPKTDPTPRALVTRKLVDQRYLKGVNTAISGANSIFSTITSPSAAASAGYTVVSNCNPSGTITPPVGSMGLYIDCTTALGYKGTATLNAQTIIFNGKVNPQATAGTAVDMPIADHVYVFGSSADAISIGNNSAIKLHTSGNVDAAGNCSTLNTASKAVMFVKDGQFKQTGGLLRMCNTTAFMMGGRPTGCLPAISSWSPDLTYVATGATAPAPTLTPCNSGTTIGTGQFSQTGGDIDWTAPNQYDVMTLPDGTPDPAKLPAWSDPNGPEDLALWSESAGNNSSTTYNMAGGGLFAVRGVFMIPNADSMILSGGALMDLTNAQFIATSISLNGNTTRVKMSVDPNSAVTLPQLTPFTLVR